MSRKNKSKTEIVRVRLPRLEIFTRPPLLEGEDAATYDQLLASIRAAVKPVDIIDEMYIANVVFLEWEVLRWRRLKSSLMRACGLKALEGFVAEQLENDCYGLYAEHFADRLANILRENFPEDQVNDAQTLAHECARNEPDADARVNKLLARINLNMDDVLAGARARKAKDLVQEYVRREPGAVTLIEELLTGAGMSMDTLMADALAEKLDDIERFDRQATIAENRRNASLREIERRQKVLGEALRHSVEEIEDAEFKEIETKPAKGRSAA